uniref:Uncharacterized protein n=1 Tax=Arundo donax TaxID=35708 RepID=A0A0A9F6G3_ARUDO
MNSMGKVAAGQNHHSGLATDIYSTDFPTLYYL